MSDILVDLIAAVFPLRNNNHYEAVQTLAKQFDRSRVDFYAVMPKAIPALPTNRTVVAWNVEYQTSEIEQLPYHYMICGSKPLTGTMPPNSEYFPWHLSATARANSMQPIAIPNNPPFLADALLGINKPERVNLFNMLCQHNLHSQCLINLYHTPQFHCGEMSYTSPALAHYEDPRVAETKTTPGKWHSMECVTSEVGSLVPASQVIPRQVYAASHLSIIAETLPTGDQFFVTEKTGKALAAGRVFLLQGGPGYLRELRNLGFRTFAPLVDESYDTILDITERNAAIVAELKRLSTVNLTELYQKLMPVLQHNQQLLYSEMLNKPAQKFLLTIRKIYKQQRAEAPLLLQSNNAHLSVKRHRMEGL